MADLAGCTLALGASLLSVLETMTRSGKQIALVVDADGRLAGVVTDGDVRRAMLRGASLDAKVDEVVNRAPLTGPAGLSAPEALQLMRARSVRHLPAPRRGSSRDRSPPPRGPASRLRPSRAGR